MASGGAVSGVLRFGVVAAVVLVLHMSVLPTADAGAYQRAGLGTEDPTAAFAEAVDRTLSQPGFTITYPGFKVRANVYQSPDRVQTPGFSNPPSADRPGTITIGECSYMETSLGSGRFYLAYVDSRALEFSPIGRLLRLRTAVGVTARTVPSGVEYRFTLPGNDPLRADVSSVTTGKALVANGLIRSLRTVTRYDDGNDSGSIVKTTLSDFANSPPVRRPRQLADPPPGVTAADPQACSAASSR